MHSFPEVAWWHPEHPSPTRRGEICLDQFFSDFRSFFSPLCGPELYHCSFLVGRKKVISRFSTRYIWFLPTSHHHHSCSLFRNLQVTASELALSWLRVAFWGQPMPSQTSIALTVELAQSSSSLEFPMFWSLTTSHMLNEHRHIKIIIFNLKYERQSKEKHQLVRSMPRQSHGLPPGCRHSVTDLEGGFQS